MSALVTRYATEAGTVWVTALALLGDPTSVGRLLADGDPHSPPT